ncbi:MAG: hypothetical protein M3Y27_09620 [Acidobacteriota bacterium]|nr:hypothetical protein [Acidobacteriota bacterium]
MDNCTLMRLIRIFVLAGLSCLLSAYAADQSKVGAGNSTAAGIADRSPLIKSARDLLEKQAGRVKDAKVRAATLDAISNPNTCVTHRAGLNESKQTAILKRLLDLGLLDVSDDRTFPNGLRAGVFPPLIDDGSACPKLPQPFYSAPGSSFGGHHSYPGGLMLHEAFNEISALNFASGYRRVYGSSNPDGLPVVGPAERADENGSDIFISQDIMIAAPIWHDWAKTFVFQWNSDGTEFQELNFGGDDAIKTGAHHILGIAEAIKRGLSPDFVITLASAHSTIEEKVVSWIRTAAVIAQVDPIASGYLRRGSNNQLHAKLLVESALHNLSDSDFIFTGPAVGEVQKMLAAVAPKFGFNAAETTTYNNGFRNVVLSYFSAERLLIIYGNSGLEGVTAEIHKIQPLLVKPP